VVVFDGLEQELYEEAVRGLTGGRERFESLADWGQTGILTHVAGQTENGFRVVDVWESEEAFARFGETLAPILQDLGVQGRPEMYPAHTFVRD
jgi:hypothetical protein